jgi:hypothetical protein
VLTAADPSERKVGERQPGAALPYRESTLKKLWDFVDEMCENLSMASSTVQL